VPSGSLLHARCAIDSLGGCRGAAGGAGGAARL